MGNKVKIEVEFDVDKIKEDIKNAKTLESDRDFFQNLVVLTKLKKKLEEAFDIYEGIEREIKQEISDKAKALYGDSWTAIKGDNFKITRSFFGSVYGVDDDTPAKWVKIKKSPNTEEINNFIKEKNTLPKGVIYSPNRTESIKIKVQNYEKN